MTNADCISELNDQELGYQISEVCQELRTLDRCSQAYDAAVIDLTEMFAERRHRREA